MESGYPYYYYDAPRAETPQESAPSAGADSGPYYYYGYGPGGMMRYMWGYYSSQTPSSSQDASNPTSSSQVPAIH